MRTLSYIMSLIKTKVDIIKMLLDPPPYMHWFICVC